MTNEPSERVIVPREVPPSACGQCGGTEDLEVRPWGGISDAAGGEGSLWYAVCRRCLREDLRRGVAAQAAYWQQVAEDPAAAGHADSAAALELVRSVAGGLRSILAREGVEPDEPTQAFIVRYAA